MHLELAWVIYRADNDSAHQEASQCMQKLQALGVRVRIARSGLKENPFPDLLNASEGLPGLAVVIGARAEQDTC